MERDYAAEEKLRQQDWLSEVPNRDLVEVNRRFGLMVRYMEAVHGCDYIDTCRVTRMSRETDWEAIERHSKKVSCCGQYDEKITSATGRLYLIGFNYGH